MAPGKETMDGCEKTEVEHNSEVKEDTSELGTDKGEEKEGNQGTEDVNKEMEEPEEGNDGEEEDRKEEKGENEDSEKIADKNVKKGSREKKKNEVSELPSPRTPGSERPARERKTVERFTMGEVGRITSPKPLAIEKGRGSQLKDIPNVAFKLSKRKADENLHLLHSILFGKKAKVHNLKRNLGMFSGFVWVENEEKQRTKVKEKLDKCVKEKLVDFCNVLNISVNKATLKKEEISTKLLEFLESPHATTDALLSDKEKSKKRKSRGSAQKNPGSSNVTAYKSAKPTKLESESGKKLKHSANEEDDGSEPSQSKDDQEDGGQQVPGVKSDQEENDSERERGEDKEEAIAQKVIEKGSSKRSARKDIGSTSTFKKSKSVDKANPANGNTKKISSSASRKGDVEAEAEDIVHAPSKKQKVNKQGEKDVNAPSKGKRKLSKSSTIVFKKDQVGQEEDSGEEDKKEPSTEEMQAIVVNILKEVDFDTATLNDILRQLGEHFGVNLMHRKLEVKGIITEVIKNMSDDENEDGAESGKDGEDDDDA